MQAQIQVSSTTWQHLKVFCVRFLIWNTLGISMRSALCSTHLMGFAASAVGTKSFTCPSQPLTDVFSPVPVASLRYRPPTHVYVLLCKARPQQNVQIDPSAEPSGIYTLSSEHLGSLRFQMDSSSCAPWYLTPAISSS